MSSKNKTPSVAATTNKGSRRKSKQKYDNSKRTQIARLLRHFREIEPRLTVEQGRSMGILDPRARISEMRNHYNFSISTTWISEPDKNGVIHRVGLYMYHGLKKEVECER